MFPQKVWSSYFQSDHLLGGHIWLLLLSWSAATAAASPCRGGWAPSQGSAPAAAGSRPEHLALKIAQQKEIQRVEVWTARGPLNTAVSLSAHCQNASSKLLRQFSHERRVPMHGCPVLLPPDFLKYKYNYRKVDKCSHSYLCTLGIDKFPLDGCKLQEPFSWN